MKSRIALVLPFLVSCSVFVPASKEKEEEKSREVSGGDADAGVPAPELQIYETGLGAFTVLPGENGDVFYRLYLSSAEDIEITAAATFVNAGDGKNMDVGRVAPAGPLTISSGGRVFNSVEGGTNAFFGNDATCTVTDRVVVKGPCLFQHLAEFTRTFSEPLLVKGGAAPVDLTFTGSIDWLAGNRDSYKLYLRALYFHRPSLPDEFVSVMMGYHGPAITVVDPTSFCDPAGGGLYGYRGCCNANGFRPASGDLSPGRLLTVPLMDAVYLVRGDGSLARFQSSREIASWFGRKTAAGLTDLDDHAACNLVRAVDPAELLGRDASHAVGLRPGENLVRTWEDGALYVLDRGKTRRPIALDVAAAIFPDTVDDRILFLTDEEMNAYRVGAPVLAPADFDPAAAWSAADIEEESL